MCLSLAGNNPNPANGDGTYITYQVCVPATVKIRVYDVAGEVVRDLDPFEALQGPNEEFWNCQNSAGNKVASGVFIYRVEAVSKRNEASHAFGKLSVVR